MSKSKIEWTDAVWNPVTGCSKVSAGCAHCYAERMSQRLAGRCGYPKDDPFKVTLHPDKLEDPLKWKKSRKIFVNSMSDLFHEDVPDEFIFKVFNTMANASWINGHTFLVLTKRPERMKNIIESIRDDLAEQAKPVKLQDGRTQHKMTFPFPLRNIWLGVSVENQATADERIPLLLQTPASVRFISAEPLLGKIDIQQINEQETLLFPLAGQFITDGMNEPRSLKYGGIDWVITGGESGPGARPMHPDWVRNLRDQCQAAGTPFFFKQWGEWAPIEEVECGVLDDNVHRLSSDIIIGIEGTSKSGEGWNGTVSSPEMIRDRPLWHLKRVGKKKAGRELDGQTWDKMPEVMSK